MTTETDLPETTVVDVLLAARDSITPQTWTQGLMFRDPRGSPVCGVDQLKVAVRWCAIGALTRAARLAQVSPATWDDALSWTCDALGGDSRPDDVIRWQDARGRTWSEVWDLFDRAAAAAKGGGL